jgi:hypothetical protein
MHIRFGVFAAAFVFLVTPAFSQHFSYGVTVFALVSAVRQAQPSSTFEVASVRPTLPGDRPSYIKGGPGRSDPERFTAVNVSLLGLVEYAFKIKPHQYAYPKLQWIDDVYFDIAANVPIGVSDESFHVMLQNLLIERFGTAYLSTNLRSFFCGAQLLQGFVKTVDPVLYISQLCLLASKLAGRFGFRRLTGGRF